MRDKWIALILLASGLLHAGQLSDLLERVSAKQRSIRTLTAEFTQVKESDFLKEQDVSGGFLYYIAPDRIRWEYTKPGRMILLIDGNRVTYYDVAQARVERSRVRKVRRKIQHYMMTTEPLETLIRYFTVTFLDEKGSDTYALKLVPTMRRIEKRVREIDLRIDRELELPTGISYQEQDGDKTTYTLRDVKVNEDIDPGLFELEIPPDVTVQEFHFKR